MRAVALLALLAAACGAERGTVLRRSNDLRLAARWDEAHRGVSQELARGDLSRDDRIALLVERAAIEREVGTYRRRAAGEDAHRTIGEAERLLDASPQAGALRIAAREERGRQIYFGAFDGEGTFDDAMPYFQASRELSERNGDRAALARSWFFIGLVHQQSGRAREAKEAFERGHAIATAAKLPVELGYLERHLASLAQEAGDLAQAEARFRRSLELREQAGHRWGVVFACLALADVLVARGDREGAMKQIDRAAALAVELDVWRGAADAAEARAALEEGAAACARREEAARAWEKYGDPRAAEAARCSQKN